MGQVSPYLRKVQSGYAHYCPACKDLHFITTEGPHRWSFNNDVNKPTFGPSVRVTGKQAIIDNNGDCLGWVLGDDGKPKDSCCHYFLTDGKLNYCGDCTHEYNGKQGINLPELPEWCSDANFSWG